MASKKKNSSSIFDEVDEPAEDDETTEAPSPDEETPAEEEAPAEGDAPAAEPVPAGEPEVELPEGQTAEPAAEQAPLALSLVPGGNPGAEPSPADAVSYEGEHLPPLTGETWVKLGESEDVPERYWGSIAAVVDPIPVATGTDEETGATYQYTPEDAILTVRERSQGGLFTIPLSAVAYASLQGRAGVHSIP
jgi:hypothetical protein